MSFRPAPAASTLSSSHRIRLFGYVLALLAAALLLAAPATARTFRLFTVGNSFSNNAVRHLPELAQAGGHELIVGKAVKGGCSLQQHWDAVAAWQADPADPNAKIYTGGVSLAEALGSGTWDIITIQQNSMNSADVATYRPFAAKLHAHLKAAQPRAEIVLHQTWAYRVDAARFGQVAPGRHAADQAEMYRLARAAYHEIAGELGVRLIPVGDAFWRVDSDPAWQFRPDAAFDDKTAAHPALPAQRHSLHVGWRWDAKKKLGKDANHAGPAGEYLGALVWYAFLFGESPEPLAYVPRGVDPAFAAHLRRVAWEVVRSAAPPAPAPRR